MNHAFMFFRALSLAASAFAAIPAPAASLATAHISDRARFPGGRSVSVLMPPMGTFQDNTPYAVFAATLSAQRERGVEAWESMLGRAKNSLIAADYYGDGSGAWAGMTAAYNGTDKPGDWKRANPDRKLLWSIPLTFAGTSLATIASGAYDGYFTAAAAAIAAAQPDAIIRIGWEMNGSWTAWYAGPGDEQHYVVAYRRVASLFRAQSSKFAFDWCTSFGVQNNDPQRAYPGDDVVDSIGMDVYDYIGASGLIVDPVQRWNDNVLAAGGRGLTWLASFAAAHNKKMSLGEWGVGLTDHTPPPAYARYKDDPTFVRLMARWQARNAERIKFQIYFNAPPNRIDDGTFPDGLAALKTSFTRSR